MDALFFLRLRDVQKTVFHLRNGCIAYQPNSSPKALACTKKQVEWV